MADIHHLFFETRFGPAAVAYATPPFKLLEVCLPRPTRAEVLAHMKYRSGGDERSHSEAERLAAMIGGYFEGHPVAIPWQLLDTQGWTTAQSAVYGTVARIPYGEVRTYGAVARLAGRPGAARFVGNCMARNPFPVLIPCHRVVAAGGGLGGFGGGLDLKRKMLDLEGRSADHG